MTGLVHLRHPCELGGIYYLVNCVMSQLSVFVAAFIYWHYVPATGDIFGAGLATATNSSAFNLTLANASIGLADLTKAPLEGTSVTATTNYTYTLADSTSASLNLVKIGFLPLVASIITLFAVWAIALVGL